MRVLNLEKLLPADLPPGEEVVWFGRPDAVSLWRRAYRADLVTAYFAALALWNFFSSAPGAEPIPALMKGLVTLGIGAGALATLGLLAYLSARTTLYFVTNKRIVLKVGIALQVFHNVPFNQIESAGLRAFADGTGDISVKLRPSQHIAYLTLWPSARPLHFANPEPTLRGVPGAREIAGLLTKTMVEATGGKAGAGVAPAAKPQRLATAATA